MYYNLNYYVKKYVPYQYWKFVDSGFDVGFVFGYSTCLFTFAMFIWCPPVKCLKII